MKNLLLCCLLLVLTSCVGQKQATEEQPTPQLSTPATLTWEAIASCPATFPNGSQPPPDFTTPDTSSPHSHGNGVLWTSPGVGGKIILASQQLAEDGSVQWKMGWDRGIHGKLNVTGKRLDASAPPAQGQYDTEGYGDIGFQAGYMHFPSVGCWEITGRVDDASMTFVTLVLQVPFEYLEPAWMPEGLNLKDQEVADLPQAFRLVYARPIWEEDQVTWGKDELVLETTQGVREDTRTYNGTVEDVVVVQGQSGVCREGIWDEQQQRWDAEANGGVLEWTAEGFTYRVSHVGLGLNCEDLLRVAE